MSDFGRILAGLSGARIPYVLIGGLSVGYHGYVRATKDVDIIVATRADALQRLRELLVGQWQATRLDGSAIPDEQFDGAHVIVAQTPYGRLDVLPEGDPPLDYATLERDAEESTVLGAPGVKVVNLAALVTLKRLAGRPSDNQDLEQLAIAHGELPEPLVDI